MHRIKQRRIEVIEPYISDSRSECLRGEVLEYIRKVSQVSQL